MPFLFPRASLKRSARTRARRPLKNSISVDADIVYPPSRSLILAPPKNRHPPLQIIPELSESQPDIDVSSTNFPATTHSFLHQPKLATSGVTLSAHTFSVDDEPSMSSDEARLPAISASSSTSDVAPGGDVSMTSGISDDEDGHDFMLTTPRVYSQHISTCPLCITKTRSAVCREDDDTHNYFGKEEEKAMPLPVTEGQSERPGDDKVATDGTEEAEQDFYTHEFENFISLSPAVASATSFARRDSLTLAAEDEVALHMEDRIFPEDKFDIHSRGPTATKEAYEADKEEGIYYQSTFAYSAPASTRQRSSTDSDAPHSSIHSVSSLTSSDSEDAPITPLSSPKLSSPVSELESTHCLRSRWSSSTMDSLATEPPQAFTILSPLKSVFGSRVRRVLLPPENVPPEMPHHLSKNKYDFPTTQSPLSTLGKRLHRQGSRSSTSSAGTHSSECNSHRGSPRESLLGLKRKSISVSMLLRTN